MAKKRQTFGKMQRERERAEKRARKQEKKDEKKAAAAAALEAEALGLPYPPPADEGEEGRIADGEPSPEGVEQQVAEVPERPPETAA